MIFVTAGMGGGTGTGSAAVVAEIAKQSGALTIAIITKPFTFEGKHRLKNAEAGIDDLVGKTDTLVIIPNDRLLQLCDQKTSMDTAFRIADGVLHHGVQAIAQTSCRKHWAGCAPPHIQNQQQKMFPSQASLPAGNAVPDPAQTGNLTQTSATGSQTFSATLRPTPARPTTAEAPQPNSEAAAPLTTTKPFFFFFVAFVQHLSRSPFSAADTPNHQVPTR